MGQHLSQSGCPGRHQLKPFQSDVDGQYTCSRCLKETPASSTLYGCRICDYDECNDCNGSSLERRMAPDGSGMYTRDEFVDYYRGTTEWDQAAGNAAVSQVSQSQVDDQKEPECVVCMSNPQTNAFGPCGHKCCCEVCAAELQRRGDTCPICRGPIRNILRVYG